MFILDQTDLFILDRQTDLFTLYFPALVRLFIVYSLYGDPPVVKGLGERELGQREISVLSFVPGIKGGRGRDGRRPLVQAASEFLNRLRTKSDSQVNLRLSLECSVVSLIQTP